MSMITGNIKSLLQIKFKNRHDNYTDQYNRIFMVKMAMISSMLLGLNWFKDTIRCTVPNFAGADKGYVHQACWIQGMQFLFCCCFLFLISNIFCLFACFCCCFYQRRVQSLNKSLKFWFNRGYFDLMRNIFIAFQV